MVVVVTADPGSSAHVQRSRPVPAAARGGGRGASSLEGAAGRARRARGSVGAALGRHGCAGGVAGQQAARQLRGPAHGSSPGEWPSEGSARSPQGPQMVAIFWQTTNAHLHCAAFTIACARCRSRQRCACAPAGVPSSGSAARRSPSRRRGAAPSPGTSRGGRRRRCGCCRPTSAATRPAAGAASSRVQQHLGRMVSPLKLAADAEDGPSYIHYSCHASGAKRTLAVCSTMLSHSMSPSAGTRRCCRCSGR